MILLSVFHLLLGSLVLLVEGLRYAVRRKLDYLSLAMVILAIFYGFAPAALHAANAIGHQHNWVPFVDYRAEAYGLGAYEIAAILGLAAYVAIWLGWSVGGRLSRPVKVPATRPVRTASRPARDLTPLAWALLAIAVAIYYPYTKAYGGYLRVLSVAPAIRGGWITTPNPWSFLKHFGGLSMYASYLFLAMLLGHASRDRKRSTALWAGTLLSIVVSLYFYVIWGARLSMVFYLLSLAIASLLSGRARVPTGKLLLALSLSATIVLFADPLIYNARRTLLGLGGVTTSGGTRAVLPEAPIDFALNELSFPIISVATAASALSAATVEPRGLKDYVFGLLYLVPKRWLPVVPTKVSAVNTHLIIPGATWEIPVDLISLALYSLGICGPPLFAFAYGIITRVVQGYVLRLEPASFRPVLFGVCGLSMARALVYADPVNVMLGSFCLVLGLVITAVYMRL